MKSIQTQAANQNFRKMALRLAAAPLALAIGLGQVVPAYATIDNTVTVTAKKPDGTALITDITATENVDVQDASGTVTITQTSTIYEADGTTLDPDQIADAGDIVKYTYTVTNTGNVTLTEVAVSDTNDGAPDPTVGTPVLANVSAGSTDDGTDSNYDSLAPGGVLTFVSSYTVTTADIIASGGGASPEGDIDGLATVNGGYFDTANAPATATDAAPTTVPLYVNSHLLITKVADDTTNVTVGQLITYTYTVTNDGNVPISDISLSDTHKGVVGALTPTFVSLTNTSTFSVNDLSDNTIELLQPGDSATYTATYTVTQSDIDTLQ